MRRNGRSIEMRRNGYWFGCLLGAVLLLPDARGRRNR